MKEFARNNGFTLIGLALGLIVGIILFNNIKKQQQYRAVYQYDITKSNLLPKKIRSDTFFIFSKIPVRNFINSYYDTIQNNGIKRSEMLIYSVNPLSDEFIQQNIVSPLSNNFGQLTLVKKERVIRTKRYIYVSACIGLLLGYFLTLFKAKLNPRKKEITIAP